MGKHHIELVEASFPLNLFHALSTVVTFPLNLSEAGGDKEPVHLEGWGIELSVKVLLEDDDSVRDCAAVLQNDCGPGLAGLEKGWRTCRELQAASVELHKEGIAGGISRDSGM